MEEEARRLTSFSHGAGCGCKLGPSDLQAVVGRLSMPAAAEQVLVGTETGDDAAVWQLADGSALVATLDFFTPIVDDPYDWGRIAATNAMSDVFAMGGTPFLALNIVSWPVDDLPIETMGQVLQGGIDAAAKESVAVLGGHSITDPEPKFGMVVVGSLDPSKVLRNSVARPGDALFLTKPLGTGIVSTAIKRGIADDDMIRRAVDQMTASNRAASEAAVETGVRAATDVTGFGLLGHLREMLLASGAAAKIDAGAVPLIPGIVDLARTGVVPGGTQRNHAFVRGSTDWGDLTEPEQLILSDAQTSGGLLIAAPDPEALSSALTARSVEHAVIGEVSVGSAGGISVWNHLGG
jgi:selenide, water dikinase